MKNSTILAVSLTYSRRIAKSLPVAILVSISSLSFPGSSLAEESASLKEISLESPTNNLAVRIYAQDNSDQLYMNIWDKKSGSFVANAMKVPLNVSQVKINSNDNGIKLWGIPGFISLFISGFVSCIANKNLAEFKSRKDTELEEFKSQKTTEIENLKTHLIFENNTKLETLKSNLTADNNAKLETLKSNLTSENNTRLEMLRNQYAKELEEYRQNLEIQASTEERIKNEIIRWANPILGAVKDLEGRLNNILQNQGFLALDKHPNANPNYQLNLNWSISYDYFMPSTLYYFAQYFCWVFLLLQELNWLIFKSQTDKDQFFQLINNVRDSLSSFSPSYFIPNNLTGKDVQVFTLQQRAIGELLIVSDEKGKGCMKYSEFQEKYEKEPLKSMLSSLRELLEAIQPGEHRWERLKAAKEAITHLREHCEGVLKVTPSQSP